MVTGAVVLALSLSAVAQDNDPDRKKNGMALLLEGMRAEEARPANLALAIAKYKKASAKAKEEKNEAVAAEALGRLALANERQEPENIQEAAAAWGEIASSYAGVKPWGERAQAKISYKGVDVWLSQFHAQLDAWRLSADRSPKALDERKKAASDKIMPLDKEAVAGLVWGLGHKDDVVRDLSAELFGLLADEAGVTAVIGKLNDANPVVRAGASSAFQRIYQKFTEAADLDRRAAELERDLATVSLQQGSKAEGQHKKLQEEAAKLKAKAGEIRKNLPATLATSDIQAALQKIIEDEGAYAQARRESALAAMKIGRISGPLVDALLKGLDSKDRNVREACARAAGGVDTSISADKHRLADRLLKAVQDEPAKAEDRSSADWANDELVRQAAAEALEQIALVKSLPALLEALDDNDSRVRHAAFRALHAITRRDIEYEKDEKTNLGKTYEADKPLEERRKAIAKWKEWLDQTRGVVVLVERFHGFQANWAAISAVKLFEPAFLLREVESRKWSVPDPKIEEDRAKRVIEEFQRRKDVFVQDAVDLGGESIEQFLKYIGGETERDGGKANAATRYFVAEVLAKIVEKHGAADAVGKLRELVGAGDSASKKAGAALALGFLPKDKVGDGEREALQVKGLGASEVEVKEAAANALGKVGSEGAAADLTKAAQDSDANVQLAALRALSLIHPKNADTVKALSDMVADEDGSKKSANPLIREAATDALGSISDPAAVPALLRARRDTARNVREAAAIATQKVHKADAKATVDEASKTLLDEKRKTEDRSGAALLLADTGDAAQAKVLSERIIDVNPPRVLRDADPGVRIKICEALGNLKAKSKTACGRLLSVMAEDGEREGVRKAAYQALCTIFGLEPGAEGSPDKDKLYEAAMGPDKRLPAVQKWQAYLDGAGLQD
jgi:HEAT repeat protein